jgi:hypothetical protein
LAPPGRAAGLDPANVARVEMGGYDTPEDERYRRVKARSMRVLQEWRKRSAERTRTNDPPRGGDQRLQRPGSVFSHCWLSLVAVAAA